MVVVAAKEETVAETIPYAAVASAFVPGVQAPIAQTPYVQTPVVQTPYVQTPVVQTPYVQAHVAHTPVAYYAPYYGYQAGLPGATYEVAPVVPVAASAPTHSQFHGQDELGGYNYGYQTAESSKQEFKTADGIVQGTYSYVDANGILQTVNYISDAEGFKVAATNLPKAPVPDAVASVPEPASYVAPAPVPYVASVPALAPYVAPTPAVEDHDDIEVISG